MSRLTLPRAAHRVKIGETGNEVELKKDEWNVRVELIRTGKRTRL